MKRISQEPAAICVVDFITTAQRKFSGSAIRLGLKKLAPEYRYDFFEENRYRNGQRFELIGIKDYVDTIIVNAIEDFNSLKEDDVSERPLMGTRDYIGVQIVSSHDTSTAQQLAKDLPDAIKTAITEVLDEFDQKYRN
jgi:hypothetical protein